jgi:hypothetical protein
MRQIIVACLVVVATGGLAGGFIWSQLSPNPIVASMSIGGQTVSVTLPIGWSRAPGSGLKFTPMNAETATPHDVTMEAYILFTFARAPASRFPSLFERDLKRARRACVGADYEDQPIRPISAIPGPATFMVLIKCRRESKAHLLIFKEMDQGMLTVERSWASSIKDAPNGADLKNWLDWANSITIVATL